MDAGSRYPRAISISRLQVSCYEKVYIYSAWNITADTVSRTMILAELL